MGLVGIWCMHFIGNRAIILGDGSPDRQLVYNAGYTTLSVFLPIIGLTIAFSAAEFPSHSKTLHWISLTCTGVFAGLSTVGMHYIGNLGVKNYTLSYAHRFLAASIIISVGDCMLVLILFYTLREKWISAWWKRLACAMLLAGGVCAMHFTASTGCIYTLRNRNGPNAIKSRNTQVAVAGALCVAAALLVVGVLFFTRHRARVLKTKSQKVMLACAMFHPDGRILVTTEGVLPAREITDKYQHRTFNEDFDTAHPVFHWIFRVTRHWSGVSELIPRMKNHLTASKNDSVERSRPVSAASSAHYDPETYNDYTIIFRERFCIAAASLAATLHIPTDRVGVLYDKIIETGTLRTEDRVGKRATVQLDKLGDMESGKSLNLFGKGQLLFLTRQLSDEDADKLLNAGFKFASVHQVGRTIAEPMQIPLAALDAHVTELKHYVDKLNTLDKPGTWLAFFGLMPRPNSKGFDVGVKKEDQDQLPDVRLLPVEPQQWQAEFLQRLDGLRTRSCMTFLEDRMQTDRQRSQQEQQFAMVLLQSMVQLAQQVPPEWFREARFLARPVFAHYSQQRHRGGVSWVYTFCAIADLHSSLEACDSITRIPLTFFSARQRCYQGSPDHTILARDIHQEFGPLLARRTVKKPGSVRIRKLSMHMPGSSRKPNKPSSTPRPKMSRSSSFGRDDESSEHELVETSRKPSEILPDKGADGDRDNVWGGILVNSETVIKSDSKSEYSNESKHLGMGMKVAVGTAKQEDTFVDELMEVTRTRFMPPKIGY
ncbi:hypothetical protein LTR36_005157 [Oleoguttula mirabilis]|uniref:MHYT domain-containing protein n=1 Tax=Oleoguttula mirabilis TaxID=1507867 RepID=A0AAV9JW80_9PEZI|nr:hypothetical protein LTR36_005157 [Oleoguttula mirabilis]